MDLPASIPSLHERFIRSAIDVLKADERIVAVCAGGSFLTSMDQWSDIDLVLVTNDSSLPTDNQARTKIAEQIGDIVSVFTGEHVGEPRLLICLYGSEPLHVDLKFVTVEQMKTRVEDPVVLFARDDTVKQVIESSPANYPMPNLQWIEDRFWTWIHYGATKLGRGELFEARSTLEFLADRVFGPIILMLHGKQPVGMRRVDFLDSEEVEILRSLCIVYEREEIKLALARGAELYVLLRDQLAAPDHCKNERAQALVMDYLNRQ